MTSEEAREHFSAAYDGELDDAQQAGFTAALESDAELRREYQGFRAMLGEAQSLDDDDEPRPDLLAGVQDKLRARSRGRFYGDRFARAGGAGLLMPTLLGIVMLLILGLAWGMMHYVQVEEASDPILETSP